MSPLINTQRSILMKQRELCSAIAASLLVGCVPSQHGAPSVESGFNPFGNGLANLVLSPLMIAEGLLEGLGGLTLQGRRLRTHVAFLSYDCRCSVGLP